MGPRVSTTCNIRFTSPSGKGVEVAQLGCQAVCEEKVLQNDP